MTPARSSTVWYRSTGIKLLACYFVSVVCIHLWVNRTADVSTLAEPTGFYLLVRNRGAPESPLELTDLGTWRARCETCSDKVLELQPGQGVPLQDGNGLHFDHSTVRPSGAGVEVTVSMHTEYYDLENVYRVEGGRVFPLAQRNDVPIFFALLVSTVSSLMLFVASAVLTWLLTQLASVIRKR